MKKSVSAFLAAMLVTSVLAGAMILIGQDAFGTSTARAAAVDSTTVSADTVTQYEQIVSQYKTRETQYQTEIAQASEQINVANQQIQQYQSLLEQLQENGLITMASDGTVTINQAGFPRHGGLH